MLSEPPQHAERDRRAAVVLAWPDLFREDHDVVTQIHQADGFLVNGEIDAGAGKERHNTSPVLAS